MIKTMQLEIFSGGGVLEREIRYEANTMEEIAKMIEDDENELLYYMQTGDTKGVRCFVFQGFMFAKASITAAQMKEPDF